MERCWKCDAYGQVRRCWKCKAEKPVSDFYSMSYKCIACYAEYYLENRERILAEKRVWYLNNIDSRAAYARKYRARKKAEQFEPRWRALP